MFTKEKIIDYADKLLIGLTDKEVEDLLDEFDVIKENMDIIDEIPNISSIKPLSFHHDIEINHYRSDEEENNINTYDALKNSKGTIEDVIEIPKVVGND